MATQRVQGRLATLPPELILRILDLARGDFGVFSIHWALIQSAYTRLSHFSLVCRTFRPLAQTLMWETVFVRDLRRANALLATGRMSQARWLQVEGHSPGKVTAKVLAQLLDAATCARTVIVDLITAVDSTVLFQPGLQSCTFLRTQSTPIQATKPSKLAPDPTFRLHSLDVDLPTASPQFLEAVFRTSAQTLSTLTLHFTPYTEQLVPGTFQRVFRLISPNLQSLILLSRPDTALTTILHSHPNLLAGLSLAVNLHELRPGAITALSSFLTLLPASTFLSKLWIYQLDKTDAKTFAKTVERAEPLLLEALGSRALSRLESFKLGGKMELYTKVTADLERRGIKVPSGWV